jgi:hypothetical protein
MPAERDTDVKWGRKIHRNQLPLMGFDSAIPWFESRRPSDECASVASNVLKRQSCYKAAMTRDQVKEILDRVLNWPPERQADVVHVVELMEEQDHSTLRLTGEQLAEVRWRRAKKNPKYVSLADARKRFRG